MTFGSASLQIKKARHGKGGVATTFWVGQYFEGVID